jgi:hypothetical protein
MAEALSYFTMSGSVMNSVYGARPMRVSAAVTH